MNFGNFATFFGTAMWNEYAKKAREVGMEPTYSGYLKYVENRTGIAPIKFINDPDEREK